jgi:hypothetical protein
VLANLIRPLRSVDLRNPAVGALAAFALALPALAVVKAHTAPHYTLSHAEAVKAARMNRTVTHALRGHDSVTTRVTPLDKRMQRVTIYDGARALVNAVVDPHGHVRSAVPPPKSGSPIANDARVLLLLTFVFILATATVPILSLRNLDVLALASFTLAIWLLNQAFLVPSLYVSYALLAYLAGRCMWMGLGGPRSAPHSSLLWHLTRNWTLAQRTRVLKLALIAAAAIVAMVVYSSTGSNDVAFACVAGATDLLHGIVPYGHIPSFIFHGDSYPLLSYAFYIPGALLLPVHDSFSDPTGALIVDLAATLLGAVGLYWIGVRLARGNLGGRGADLEAPRFAGMRIALAWLAFPAVILSASSGTNDPLLAAWLIAAFLCFARRGASVFLLGVAAWVKVVPAIALPLWLARLPRRAALRAVLALAALCATLLGFLLVLGGPGALSAMLHGMVFQIDRAGLLSLWVGLGLGALQPFAGALVLAAIVAATLAVLRDTNLRDDLRRMAALFAGLVLLAQIGANYWTWAYLPWALVPLLLSLLAPASDGSAAAPAPRQARASHGRAVGRRRRKPQIVAH